MPFDAKALGRKVGPLPVWGWAALGLLLVGAVMLLRPKTAASAPQQDTSSSDLAATTATGGAGDQPAPATGISTDSLQALLDANNQTLQNLLQQVYNGPGSTPSQGPAGAPSPGPASQSNQPNSSGAGTSGTGGSGIFGTNIPAGGALGLVYSTPTAQTISNYATYVTSTEPATIPAGGYYSQIPTASGASTPAPAGPMNPPVITGHGAVGY